MAEPLSTEGVPAAIDYTHKVLNDGDLLIAQARAATRFMRERAFSVMRDEDVPGMAFGYPELDERYRSENS